MSWSMPTGAPWGAGVGGLSAGGPGSVMPTTDMSAMGNFPQDQWAMVQQQQNWQQWAQWQQQYAQWQNQYGEKYAQQMQQMSGMGGMVPPPPAGAPPPAPPPPDQPPPPPPHENDQPLFATTPVKTLGSGSTQNPGNKQNWSQSDGNAEALQKLAEEERLFDIQFKKWEEEIEKWKVDNVNHPDKQAYKEYEDKFEACRAQLMERRHQMNMKRAKLLGTATPADSTLTAPPPEVGKPKPPVDDSQKFYVKPPQTYNNQLNNRQQNIDNRHRGVENRQPNVDNRHQGVENRHPNVDNRQQGIDNRQSHINRQQNYEGSQDGYDNVNQQNYDGGHQCYDDRGQSFNNRQQNQNHRQNNFDNRQNNFDNRQNNQQQNFDNQSSNFNNRNQQNFANNQQQRFNQNNKSQRFDRQSQSFNNNQSQNYNNRGNFDRNSQNNQQRSFDNEVSYDNCDDYSHMSMETDNNVDPEDRYDSYQEQEYQEYQEYQDDYNTSESNTNFFPSSGSGQGIPGLDLVPPRPADDDDVVEVPLDQPPPRQAPAPQPQGPDYTKISLGINNILGDEKIMNILNMVRGQTQPNAPNQSAPGPMLGHDQHVTQQRFPMQEQHSRPPLLPMPKQPEPLMPLMQARPFAVPPPPVNSNFNRQNMQGMQDNSGGQRYQGMQEQSGPDVGGFQAGPGRGPPPAPPVPKWVDEPLFTPSVIVEYEHVPLRLKARDFIEPAHTFDYNHISKDKEFKSDEIEKELDKDVFKKWPAREEDYFERKSSFDKYVREPTRDFDRRAPHDERDEYRSRAPSPSEEFFNRRPVDHRRDDRRRDERDRHRDFSPRRERERFREPSPRRERERGFSPRRDREREFSPRRDREREFSPRRERPRELSPRRDREWEFSQRRDREREFSPRRDREREREREQRERPRERERRSREPDARARGPSADSQRARAPAAARQDRPALQSRRHVVMIDDLLEPPGRDTRPEKIIVILRGPPGSGKSYLAKLIRDREAEYKSTARIMSIDDYFMQEYEVEEKDPATGKMIKKPSMKYEYDENMEESYLNSLKRAFKRCISDGFFNFLIFDAVNDQLKSYADIWNFGRQNGFQVYIATMELDAQTCHKRNVHRRSLEDVQVICSRFFRTPPQHVQLDVTNLLQSAAIQDVHMEDVEEAAAPADDVEVVENSFTSKWEAMDDANKLARLDGTSKPLRASQLSMADYLQLDDWQPTKSQPGKKTVRWADIEETRQQEKMRAIGFVVGQTDWRRMTDPTLGSSALTQTKYIERVRKH